MPSLNTDIDIDVADRNKILRHISHIPATMIHTGRLMRHNSGVYVHEVPYNPETGLCSMTYKEADSKGFFKLDLLNFNLYESIETEEQLIELMEKEPVWELLHYEEICDKIVHVNGYHSVMRRLNPTSIEQLAMALSLIRPAKKHLLTKAYTHGIDSVLDEIWVIDKNDGYAFKRSHAIAYATAVVVNLNLVSENS